MERKPAGSPKDGLEKLKARWKYLYSEYLPALARSKDPAQRSWPVVLDHCFARIILDNAFGMDRPWTDMVPKPAVAHMTIPQIERAIELAEHIAMGTEDLAKLDEESLRLRGKASKRAGQQNAKREMNGNKAGRQRKRNQADDLTRIRKRRRVSSERLEELSVIKGMDHTQARKKRDGDFTKEKAAMSSYLQASNFETIRSTKIDGPTLSSISLANPRARGIEDDMTGPLSLIVSSSALTSFRKLALSLLCQIPRGKYSTYGAISDFIGRTSHKTCARAVGSAMRNNPFAPVVPCHRVLAGDGSLGGFGGSWGENGIHAKEKRRLLNEEGVKFDGKGKVVGPPFKDFHVIDESTA